MSKNSKNSSPEAAYAGPGRRVITMIEHLTDERHRTARARDRGDTMIEITHLVTAQGGQARVEVEELDGAKFSLTVAAPPPALEGPATPKAVLPEVPAPPAALELGDGSRAE